MMDAYKETPLWVRSLGQKDDAGEACERLRSCYSSFRSNASRLTAKIAESLPDLTIHDVTHLDALWETADLIAGDQYPLNPMEGFVLGGAFLIHDAALCFDAYEGGQAAIRRTIEWKDVYASEKDKDPSLDEHNLLLKSDFGTLRSLHASQAALLCDRAWGADRTFYLIDNTGLRKNFGKVIGQIASSHHWSIEDLISKLPSQLNAPAEFPRNWRVDPIKIACLLRCADAAHIDERRAPDFLQALSRRQGISSDHWKAQNWLSRVDIDQSDISGTSLLFASNRAFKEEDADAWWVAHDAVRLVEREIKASNTLMFSRAQREVSPPFKMVRVSGVETPETLSEHIRVEGWQPCAAKIHIGDVERLVRNLGGEKLYGDHDKIVVVLRELVQNARDAIKARSSQEGTPDTAVKVSIDQDEHGKTILIVEDGGVGMSHRVLTGPLLDFGTSFWISDLARQEYPGLRASAFRSIGQFGIGFYSIFMVAEKVTIASRRWDAALDEVNTLTFAKGLTLRPTLKRGRPSDYGASSVTRISCVMKSEVGDLREFKISSGQMDKPPFTVEFPEILPVITAGLDVDVDMEHYGQKRKVHTALSTLTTEAELLLWLEQISYAKHRETDAFLPKIAKRLRPIIKGSRLVGMAALADQIDNNIDFLHVPTVGGLSTSVHARPSDRFYGFIDSQAMTAKREYSFLHEAKNEDIEKWAREQIEIMKNDTNDAGWYAASCALANLGVDPFGVARAIVSIGDNLTVINLDEAVDFVNTSGLAIIKSRNIDFMDMYSYNTSVEDFPTLRAMSGGAYHALALNEDKPRSPYSLIGCVFRQAEERKIEIQIDYRPRVGSSLLGELDAYILRPRI